MALAQLLQALISLPMQEFARGARKEFDCAHCALLPGENTSSSAPRTARNRSRCVVALHATVDWMEKTEKTVAPTPQVPVHEYIYFFRFGRTRAVYIRRPVPCGRGERAGPGNTVRPLADCAERRRSRLDPILAHPSAQDRGGIRGGSSPDLVARTLAEPLRAIFGQPVIVENHPGASGNIAADIVAKSTDQHTIGMLINGNMTIAKVLNPATPYDPQKDLVPISLICTAPLLLAAPVDAPGTDARAFFAAARGAGDAWSYGTPGVGTIGHLGMELLKAQSGIAPVHIPYLGNPQVIAGLAGGQIQLALLPPGLADVQIRAGRLRAIGVTSAKRSPLVPNYPALSEVGIDGFQLEIWTAAAGPASLPAPIVARLSQAIGEIVRSADVRQKLFQQGYLAVGSSSEALGIRVREDTAALSAIIKRQGLKLD